MARLGCEVFLRAAVTAVFIVSILMLRAAPLATAAGTCPGAAGPPVAAGSSPIPTGLPSTGGGFGGSNCGSDPEACGDGGPASADAATAQMQEGDVSTDAWVGLLMLPLIPISYAQLAADPCLPAPPPLPMGGGAPRTSIDPSEGALPVPVACPPTPGPPSLPDARQVALGIAVPYPDIQVGINPSPLGLTGLPSWFWIEGYDGRSLDAATTINVPPQVPVGYPASCPQPPGASLSVAVRFSPSSYDWTFGDRLPTSTLTTTSLGEAYPQQSSIRHVYEYTSLGRPAGFAVSVTVHFVAQYQANGGAWQTLPAVAKTYSRNYPVQQAQSVLVNGR